MSKRIAKGLGMTSSGAYVFIMSTLQTEEPFVHSTFPSWIITSQNEKMVILWAQSSTPMPNTLDLAVNDNQTVFLKVSINLLCVSKLVRNFFFQGIPFQVYPSDSTMLISFLLSYTEDSLRDLRRDIFALSLEQYNYTFPRQQVGVQNYTFLFSFPIRLMKNKMASSPGHLDSNIWLRALWIVSHLRNGKAILCFRPYKGHISLNLSNIKFFLTLVGAQWNLLKHWPSVGWIRTSSALPQSQLHLTHRWSVHQPGGWTVKWHLLWTVQCYKRALCGRPVVGLQGKPYRIFSLEWNWQYVIQCILNLFKHSRPSNIPIETML